MELTEKTSSRWYKYIPNKCFHLYFKMNPHMNVIALIGVNDPCSLFIQNNTMSLSRSAIIKRSKYTWNF